VSGHSEVGFILLRCILNEYYASSASIPPHSQVLGGPHSSSGEVLSDDEASGARPPEIPTFPHISITGRLGQETECRLLLLALEQLGELIRLQTKRGKGSCGVTGGVDESCSCHVSPQRWLYWVRFSLRPLLLAASPHLDSSTSAKVENQP